MQDFDLVIRGTQRIFSSLEVLLAGNWVLLRAAGENVRAAGGKKALLGKTKINDAHGRPFAYLLHRRINFLSSEHICSCQTPTLSRPTTTTTTSSGG